ncbi:MAG: GIY-YIG nuclease family protein [Geminicoccaceae bacterium]
MSIGTSDAASLPNEPGAYLLLIQLGGPTPLPPRFDNQLLPEGHYGYAGSAYGPGGIRARCRRHLGRPAKQRWHIDWLTRMATDVQAIPFPDGSECRLIDSLSRRVRVAFPIHGFGSTDCQHCRAHLVRFEGYGRPDELGSALDL